MKRRPSIYSRMLYCLAVAVFMGVFFGLAAQNSPESVAVKATDFQAGRIIDDEIFYNPDTMTVAQIQAHLDKYSASCDMWGEQAIGYGRKINGVAVNPNVTRREYARMMRNAGRTDYHDAPYVCISKYYENPTTHKTNYDTNAEPEEGMISAAQIIYDAAHKYNINPQVLLVMLKKESYVWGDTWPLKNEYNTVMGYACPDNAPCDSTYFGFYNQVMKAAWQLNYYKEHIYSYGYYPYMTNNIYYSPNYSCGTKSVYLENIATTSLYIYTPYTPNDAALANYPGEAYCGSYGNRNFFMFFSEWFGSTFVEKYDNISKLIEEYYASIGGEKSILGKAKGEVSCSRSGGKKRCYKEYEVGFIYANDKEAWDISGGILTYWQKLGGASSYLGYPTGTEKRGLSNGGAMQSFENGDIYWTPAAGGFTVAGGIMDKWKKLDEKESVGLPLAGEQKDENGIVYQQFEKGRIYWTAEKGAWIIMDHYVKRWTELKGNKGLFNYPVANEKCDLKDGGCYLEFKIGYMYWHPKHGAWDVSGGILDEWKKLDKENGVLGYPTSGEQKDTNGLVYQQFENGRIYWTAEKGSWRMEDHYVERWTELKGNKGIFNYPTSDEKCGLSSNGCYLSFSIGYMYWHPEYGTWDVSGGVLTKWKELNKEKGALGYPTSGEQKDENGLVYQQFENGRIYWTAEKGAWVIMNHYVKHWTELGANKSIFDYPIIAEQCGLTGGGCYSQFKIGSMYWHPEHGTWDVSGGILQKYWETGTEWGYLGYPMSGEQKDEDGIVYQQFEKGRIYWTAEKGAWVVQ